MLISQLDFLFSALRVQAPGKFDLLIPVNNAKVGKYKRQQERKKMESEIIILEKSKSVTFYLLKSLLLFSSILITLTNALRK